MVFDACRKELNLSGGLAKAIGQDKGFLPVANNAGLPIAYATAPNRTASDAGEGGGPYAKALAEELLKPGIEAVTMFRNVQIRVKQAIGQDPWLSFPSLAPIYLAGQNPAEASQTIQPQVQSEAKPQMPEAETEAAQEWARVDQSSTASLQAFLDPHGASSFAIEARAKLAGMTVKTAAVTRGRLCPLPWRPRLPKHATAVFSFPLRTERAPASNPVRAKASGIVRNARKWCPFHPVASRWARPHTSRAANPAKARSTR